MEFAGTRAVIILFLISSAGMCAAEEKESLDTYNLSEVVVTATKTERILADVAQDVSVITEKQIRQTNAQTLADILKYTPGVDVSQQDDIPGVSTWKATMRGMSIDNGYGLLLINGTRVKGRGMGEYGNGLNQIPVETIERIEILKGPGSVLYGSDAIAGIINVITKPVADNETFSMFTDYGTKKTAREGFTYSNRMKKFGFRTSGNMERTDINEYEGRFLNNRLNYDFDSNTNLKFDLDLSELKTPKQDEARIRFSPTFNMNLGNGSKFVAKGYWYDWDFVHSSRKGDIIYSQAETQYTTFLSVRHRITTGLEFLRQTLEYKYKGKNQWPLVSNDIDTYSIYLQDEWSPSNEFYLVIGARFDSHSSYGEVVSPRISGLVNITDKTRIRASIGRSFKSPTIRQLYYPEPFSHGNTEYIISNPDLKPEYGIGYSLSLEKEFGNSLLGNIALFRNDLDNMVSAYYTGQQYFAKPLKSYENVDSAYTQGVEMELRLQMMKGISTSAYLTFTDTKNKDTGKEIRFQPKHSEGWRVHYANTPYKFKINWGLKYVGAMYMDIENTRKTDGYFIAEANIIKELTEHANFSLEFDNILNSDYGDPSLEREGRIVMGKLNLMY